MEIYITHAKRTMIGKFIGALSTIPASKLGGMLLAKTIPAPLLAHVESVIMGQVLGALSGQNPARIAALKGGAPITAPCYTVNQVCGSGLLAILLASHAILANQHDFVLAGGQENMSLSPHAAHLRNPTKSGELKLQDTMLVDGLWDNFNDYHMGITAENVAQKYNISRIAQDEFATYSQQKAVAAQAKGWFVDEIIPLELPTKEGGQVLAEDEYIKPHTTTEVLAKLKPAFKSDGTVTAGNASGVNDGAAILGLASERFIKQHNIMPLARIAATANTGLAPEIMGMGPVSAIEKALKIAGWHQDEVDLFEINEAFAAQALAVLNTLQLDHTRVNIAGGAIALGHPIGASGARIVVTLLHSLKRTGKRRGVAALCVGGGMGIAICVEII